MLPDLYNFIVRYIDPYENFVRNMLVLFSFLLFNTDFITQNNQKPLNFVLKKSEFH